VLAAALQEHGTDAIADTLTEQAAEAAQGGLRGLTYALLLAIGLALWLYGRRRRAERLAEERRRLGQRLERLYCPLEAWWIAARPILEALEALDATERSSAFGLERRWRSRVDALRDLLLRGRGQEEPEAREALERLLVYAGRLEALETLEEAEAPPSFPRTELRRLLEPLESLRGRHDRLLADKEAEPRPQGSNDLPGTPIDE